MTNDTNDCQTASGDFIIFFIFFIYDTPSRYLETAILVHSVQMHIFPRSPADQTSRMGVWGMFQGHVGMLQHTERCLLAKNSLQHESD